MIKKTFLSMVLISFGVIVACFALVTVIFFHAFDGMYHTKLENESAYICKGIQLDGLDYLQGLDLENCRVTWVDQNGTVVYDSAVSSEVMENHKQREEIREAFETGTGESVRYSDTLSTKTSYYARLLEDGTVVRVSSSSDTLLHLFARMMKPLLLVFFGTMAVAAFFSYRTARKIVEPLEDLDLEHPEKVDTYEELTPFLRRIEQQNKQIRSQMQELKQQQEEFSAITENMNEGFLVIDTKQRILSYNSSALRLLGSSDEADPKYVMEMNRDETIQTAILDALEGTHNEQLLKVEGRVYSLLANPVFQEDQVTGVIMVVMDVTEKEQRNSLRREFTANVSHELKTPLTSISGTAEIMKGGLVKTEDIPYFADMIYKEAQRLIHLVGDILNLSKLEETGHLTERVEVDLTHLAQITAESLQPAAKKKQVTFQTDIDPNCKMQGVLSVLDEIIYNLCDNAIKYNVTGGKVSLILRNRKKEILLSVEDTGIGIPYQEQQRVFERFYRVDKSHSKAIGGTGLGLSIVKHGVLTLGGDLQLESREGVGTRITVRFPKES